MYYQKLRGALSKGQHLNKLIWFKGNISHGVAQGPVAFSRRLQSCMFAPQNVRYFFALSLYSSLISLLLWLFSYLHKKKESPRSIIFASLFTRLVVILPSADQHVQYNVLHSRRLFGFLRRERETLFSCFSPRFRAFFSLLSGLLMRLV